ncbi:uncharacterized protein EAE97_001395 [Botrytis byssoidea]|uniref:Uncharacterized protein n=1 Tax=Botrytis byssoidea TaxID=139641 RepID=A0A9P5IUF2_9HELO|nr:uncharacterized protein EAE97_001395 [Botrytis byssoidea]KAF7953997.1 hypothetical protein EAE97_001395 [Botrytis byssoidea]
MSPNPPHFTAIEMTQQPAASTTCQTGAGSTRQEKPHHSKSTKRDTIFEYKIQGGRTLEEGINGLKNGTDMVVLYKPAKREQN